jgi:catechol 2,3-dioxygenase-like lactoylglutathione lyase family enzyme
MKGLLSRAQIILYVSDMNRAVKFWRDEMGLALTSHKDTEDFAEEHWVTLDAQGCEIALHPGGAEGDKDSPAFSLFVQDLEAALAEIEGRGVQHSGVQNPYPGVTFAAVSDPDGHPFFIKPITG